MPDVAVSLCGGLDNPEGKELSSLLFEQSLLTFDDFVLRIRENKDILADPDLVVRIGDKYYNWQVRLFSMTMREVADANDPS